VSKQSESPVLVGIDFSSGSRAAFAWAVDAALAFDAPLVALHVVHDPAEAPGYYVREDSTKVEELERVAQQMLDDFLTEVREAMPRLGALCGLESWVVVGLPATRIIEVADREGAQLIVMGAHGRTGLADALLGSKVERVTRLARIPVTVVKELQADAPNLDAAEAD